MIEAAERDGRLQPGGTIIEPTSGNTGTGLAIAARLKGYRVIAVMPDKMSKEKIDLLRAYGAEVVVAPTDVAPDSPRSYYRVADRLTREIPGAFQPNQYANPANPQTHYETTGPELWRQTDGKLTHLVVGVGTGGTITGTARYLKEQNPAIEVIGADPVGSIYSNEEVHPYLVEGVGEDFWPATYDPTRHRPLRHRLRPRQLPHHPPARGDRGDAGRRLVRARGARGARGRAATSTSPALIVVILPDGGRALPLEDLQRRVDGLQYGFLERAEDKTVGDVLHAKDAAGEMPAVRGRAARARRCARRSRCCTSTASRQLPVVEDERRSSARSASAGCCGARSRNPSMMDSVIVEVMEEPFPAVSTERLGARGGRAAGRRAPGADHGDRATASRAGIVTRADLLESLVT